MLQNTSKTLGFQKIMVYKTPPGGGGKPYLARGLCIVYLKFSIALQTLVFGQGSYTALMKEILSHVSTETFPS